MNPKSMVDKLMDMCETHAHSIADQWYQALSTNARTTACLSIPKEVCLKHAANFYKSISDMYQAEDCFKAVEQNLEMNGFVDVFFARSVPLEQVQYALILLRRHIWIYADRQMLFNPSAMDMHLAVDSINRILLVFDYATFIVTRTYREMEEKASQTPARVKGK
jgi:hypothetical protein